MTKRQHTIDAYAVRKMVLVIKNDGRLHQQRMIAIIAHLNKKAVKGIFDAVKAVKLLEYAVTDYERANGVEIVGRRMNKGERHAVAVELLHGLCDTYTMHESIMNAVKGANL